MPRRPLVSVLVPTYNGQAFLDEALSGIRRQTYPELEVLIRDDGSSDATAEIAHHYVNSDPRFRYFPVDTRRGSTGNMVELLHRAEGMFIKVCNQDDVLVPECIDLLLRPMVANESIVLATSARELIDRAGKPLPQQTFSTPLCEVDSEIPGEELARHLMLAGVNQVGEPSTVLFRNGLFDPADLFVFDGVTYEINNDIALWLKTLLRGNGYFCIRKLSKFRIHDQQRSADATERVTGTLEWLTLLSSALRLGIVKPGAEARLVARNVIQSFQWLTEMTMQVPDNDAQLRRISEGIAALRAIVDGNADSPRPTAPA